MGMSKEEREAFVEEAKEAFTQRLASIANDPAEWLAWIETVAEFGAQYSFNNQFLLMFQCMQRGVEPRFFQAYGPRKPEDRSYGWRKHRRHVVKDAQAFRIWAPIRKRPTEDEARKIEAQTGRKIRRDGDGRPSMQVVGFKLGSTFELSQTEPDEGFEHVEFVVPTVAVQRRQKLIGGREAVLLTGDDPTNAYDDVIKLIEATGYTYSVVERGSGHLKGMYSRANGITVWGDRTVQVAADLEPAQRIKTAIHELAHIRCDHQSGFRDGEDLHRGKKETEAESVAHIVCKALGLDTEPYTDAYVLGWADGDMDLIRSTMDTVMRVAKEILADLTPAVEELPETEPAPVVVVEEMPTGTLKKLGIKVGDTATFRLRDWRSEDVDAVIVVTGVVERSKANPKIVHVRLADGSTREIGGFSSKVAGRLVAQPEHEQEAAA